MFAAIREKRSAKRLIRRLLKSHAAIIAKDPGLTGDALYRQVLIHSQIVAPSHVDQLLWEAEDSVDEWTTHGQEGLGLRQVAHYVVLSQRAAGHEGTVASIRSIVYSLIPADM